MQHQTKPASAAARRFSAERRAKDLAMARDPERWPRHPMLPVKMQEGDPRGPHYFGFLYANGKPTVYFGNFHRLRDDVPHAEDAALLASIEHRDFPTMEAVFEVYVVD